MLPDDIKLLCDTLEFQIFSSFASSPTLRDWLARNGQILDMFGHLQYNRDQVHDFYASQVSKKPIRMSDIAPGLEKLDGQTIEVNSKWSKEYQTKLAIIWEVYSRDLDSIHHQLISHWNETRELFLEFNQIVPWQSIDVQTIDNNIQTYIQRIEGDFKASLYHSILAMLDKPIESEELKFKRVVQGKRQPIESSHEKLKSEVEALWNSGKSITKVDKFRIIQVSGCTLDQLNSMINKQVAGISQNSIYPLLPKDSMLGSSSDIHISDNNCNVNFQSVSRWSQ